MFILLHLKGKYKIAKHKKFISPAHSFSFFSRLLKKIKKAMFANMHGFSEIAPHFFLKMTVSNEINKTIKQKVIKC